MKWLIENYQLTPPTEKIVTVGISINSEDAELLESVDLPISTLKTTNLDGFSGWLKALRKAISNIV
ncbi:MAG: hypothetical protein Tsb0014_41680 [Pleurocapsa sp.]